MQLKTRAYAKLAALLIVAFVSMCPVQGVSHAEDAKQAAKEWTKIGIPKTIVEKFDSSGVLQLQNGDLMFVGTKTYGSYIYRTRTNNWEKLAGVSQEGQALAPVQLADGRVMVFTGFVDRVYYTKKDATTESVNREEKYIMKAEIYDFKTKKWSFTGNLINKRSLLMNAILLKNGKVMVVGGNNSMEIYDPKTNKWTRTILDVASTTKPVPMKDGRVFLFNQDGFRADHYRVYDPATNKISSSQTFPEKEIVQKRPNDVLFYEQHVIGQGVLMSDGRLFFTSDLGYFIYSPDHDEWVFSTYEQKVGGHTFLAGNRTYSALVLPGNKVLIQHSSVDNVAPISAKPQIKTTAHGQYLFDGNNNRIRTFEGIKEQFTPQLYATPNGQVLALGNMSYIRVPGSWDTEKKRMLTTMNRMPASNLTALFKAVDKGLDEKLQTKEVLDLKRKAIHDQGKAQVYIQFIALLSKIKAELDKPEYAGIDYRSISNIYEIFSKTTQNKIEMKVTLKYVLDNSEYKGVKHEINVAKPTDEHAIKLANLMVQTIGYRIPEELISKVYSNRAENQNMLETKKYTGETDGRTYVVRMSMEKDNQVDIIMDM